MKQIYIIKNIFQSILKLVYQIIRCTLTYPFNRWVFEFLSAMGPIWIKVGQSVSHRNDLFPNYILRQLVKLTEKNHYIKYSDLNVRLPRQVNILSHKPLGAGCIAMTYIGLYNSKKVVIKIARPNIKLSAISDILLFKFIIKLICFIFPNVRRVMSAIQLDTIEKLMMEQCDLRNESRNLRKFCLLYNNIVPQIRIPQVYFSSNRILVMEFMDGERLDRFCSSNSSMCNEVIDLYNLFYKKMVYVDGFVHADLHPGNCCIKIDEYGKPILNIYDFGMVIKLRKQQIDIFRRMFFSTVLLDLEEIVYCAKYYNPHISKNFFHDLNNNFGTYIKLVRIYKKLFNQCMKTPNYDTFKRVTDVRNSALDVKVNIQKLFDLMYQHNISFPSEIMYILLDLDRILRISTKYQRGTSQCFLRSLFRAVKLDIVDFVPKTILKMEPFFKRIKHRNVQWSLSSSKGRSVYSDIRKKSKSVKSFKTYKSSKTVNTMSETMSDTSSVSNFFSTF